MKLSWRQSQNTIFLLWESKRSIGDIIDTLGWSPKATGNVTRVLRTRYALPAGLRGEQLLDLTIEDAGEEYCLETRIYRAENPQEDPDLLKDILAKKNFTLNKKADLRPFGAMQAYEKATTRIKIIKKEAENITNVLVMAEGEKTPVEDAMEAVHYFYERAGYNLTDPEE